MNVRKAACSCGQLEVKVTGEPVRVSVCHCLACQRRTGSIFGAQARFPRDAVEFFGTGSEYRRAGDSGGIAKFTFCPNCGATVWYVIEGQEDLIAIPVGAFADPEFPPPIYSVYETRKHAWVSLAPQIERMD